MTSKLWKLLVLSMTSLKFRLIPSKTLSPVVISADKIAMMANSDIKAPLCRIIFALAI
jgi:hypothetical protein